SNKTNIQEILNTYKNVGSNEADSFFNKNKSELSNLFGTLPQEYSHDDLEASLSKYINDRYFDNDISDIVKDIQDDLEDVISSESEDFHTHFKKVIDSFRSGFTSKIADLVGSLIG
ncbi:unnamed protein product, partial [marine sediment metagenome]